MKLVKLSVLAAAIAVLAGCNNVKQESAEVMDLNNHDLYEAHSDGRIYVFDDRETYAEFVSLGETSYRHTLIGAGPHGETLVYGLTSADKKKPIEEIAGYNLYNGKLAPAEDFYGELRMDGRIYVTDSMDDFMKVATTGDAPLRYTQIGEGPNGETLVYVLRDDNKKVKPEALIAKFESMNM